MHPVASYTENWLFNHQRVNVHPDRIVTRYERRWGQRAERFFPLGDLREDPDRYWAKDYAWAKVYTVIVLVLFTVCFIGLHGWNGWTPVQEWAGSSIMLLCVLVALFMAGILLAFAYAPRIEYTGFMRRAGGDGFWIGKRGPNRGEYESFIATIRDHIGKAAKAA
jgi:hypothetical protein